MIALDTTELDKAVADFEEARRVASDAHVARVAAEERAAAAHEMAEKAEAEFLERVDQGEDPDDASATAVSNLSLRAKAASRAVITATSREDSAVKAALEAKDAVDLSRRPFRIRRHEDCVAEVKRLTRLLGEARIAMFMNATGAAAENNSDWTPVDGFSHQLCEAPQIHHELGLDETGISQAVGRTLDSFGALSFSDCLAMLAK